MVAVLGWLKFKRQRVEPLKGAPATRRLKTYSAESGYVYQYVFAGQRPAAHEGASGIEYAFEVTQTGTARRRIWVFVADRALAPWVDENGRALSNSERYGVAKIALRNAFDQRAPADLMERIAPGAEEVRTILDELGV